MTNGEKMQAVFPDIEMWGESKDTLDYSLGGMIHRVTKSWWNSEYKEPTTKNNLGVDCISRADAIKAMQDKAKELKNEDTINGLCGAVAILFDLPSVTPQPRKGHWIYDYTSADGHRTYHCSECGCYLQPKHSEPLRSFKWCSLCGARMVEPQKSEE